MHVCMVSTGWYPVLPSRVGAIEPTAYSICTQLSATDYVDFIGIGEGTECHQNLRVYTLYPERVPQKMEKILGHRLGYHLPFNTALIKKIRKIHKKNPIDILHIHDAHSGFAAAFSKFSLGIPFVFTIHNEVQSSLSFQSCDRVLAVSKYIKDFLVEKRNIAESKVEVSYFGVDTDFHKPMSHLQTKKDMGLGDRSILLFVGRKCPQKGPQTIIEALPSIVKNNPEVLAIFVGPDFFFKETSVDYTNYLLARAEYLGVKKNVFFQAFVSDIQLRNYYDAADISVAPSTWPDPCPQVVKEALSHGKPVVSCNIGGIPDVITTGHNGLLVPPNDPIALAGAINDLLQNPQYAEKLGKNGRRVAEEKFSIKKTAADYRRIYREVCNII